MSLARWIDAARARSRTLFGRRRDESDVRDELEFHLAMQVRANREQGMTDQEAQRRARAALGGFTQTKELARDVRPLQWLARSARDLRYTLRSLRRAPGFTVVAIVTIGLAIGACTSMYSVVHGVVLKPLPYPEPDRLVHLWQRQRQGEQGNFAEANFLDLRAAASSFSGVALYSQGTTAVIAGTEPRRVSQAIVSRDFFDVFATEPEVGRRFATAELTEQGPQAAIISDRLWRQEYGARRDLSGARLRVRGTPTAVVGVMPAGFNFPAGTDIWMPRELTAASPFRTAHNWRVVGRLRERVSLAAARAEATSIARRLKETHGNDTWMTDVAVIPLRDELVGDVRGVLLLLLASVGLLLVVATASLANLLLVRATGRQRELAVRAALGASGSSLMIPLAAESIVLSIGGGVLGLGLASAVLGSLRANTLVSLPRVSEISLSWPVLGFALAVTLCTALALGVLIAWRVRRPGIVHWLKDAQRGSTGGASLRRVRNVVVVTQLSISVVLLVGAGLLGRSLSHLLSQNLGYRTDGILAVQTTIPRPSIRFTASGIEVADPHSLSRQVEFNRVTIDRLSMLPGVTAAGGINALPLGSGYSNGTFLIVRGDEPLAMRDLGPLFNDPLRAGIADFRVASAGYFTAMGIPLIRGRLFDVRDTAQAPHAAVISESLARKRWPDSNPLGVRIQFGGMDGDMTPFTIVGIVGDVRERGFDSQPPLMFYADYRQRPLSTFDFNVVLQTSVQPASLIPDARRILAEMAPEMPPRFQTIRQALDGTTASRRFTLGLTTFFAGAATLLALLGIYGVLSYLVEQRRQEFGVRMALGARPVDVRRLVMREATSLIVVGLTLGIGASLALSNLLDRLVFGITTTDMVTYAIVTVVLGVAALVAGQLPAMRATRVDPVRALHEG